jgi:hypothetical protein
MPAMLPRSLRRLGLIVLGYVAAGFAGALCVWLKNRGVSEADMLAMSGMFAFGDAITFLLVASMVAIVPTLRLFQFVGTAPRFWRAYSIGSLCLSSTGLIAAGLWLLPFHTPYQTLEALRSVSVLRVLTAPLFLLVAVPGLRPAAGRNRNRSLLACACELAAMGVFVVWMVFRLVLGA